MDGHFIPGGLIYVIPLNEFSICDYDPFKMYIDIDPVGSETYGPNTAYFKLYNKRSHNSATKIARITICNPTYIIHADKYRDWILSSSEMKKLNDLMHMAPTKPEYAMYPSVWHAVSGKFSEVYGSRTGHYIDFGDDIPDFTNINPASKSYHKRH